MQEYASEMVNGAFADSCSRFGAMVDFLSGEQAAGMTHAELEERLHTDGMRLLCQLLQDSLDLRAGREERLVCSVIEALRAQFEEPHDHLHIKQLRTNGGSPLQARLSAVEPVAPSVCSRRISAWPA